MIIRLSLFILGCISGCKSCNNLIINLICGAGGTVRKHIIHRVRVSRYLLPCSVFPEAGINKNYDQNGCHHTGKYPPQAEGFSCLFRYLVFLFKSLQCFLRIQLVLLIVAQDKVKAFFIRGSHTLLF